MPHRQPTGKLAGIVLGDAAALLHQLRWPGAVMILYSVAAVLLDQLYLGKVNEIPAKTHGQLGLLLGLLLVFRTNTAYDRWWEARKLWGQLAADCRNMCIKVSSLPNVSPVEALELGEQLARFARTLKDQLRGEPDCVPARVAIVVRDLIARWRQAEKIDGFDQIILDTQANVLMDVAGGCDRIRQTPIPRSYLALIRLSIVIYLVTLPWGLVNEFGFWAVPASVVVALFMVGLETIAEQIEDPFGTGTDDLPMDEVCRGLESSLRSIVAASPGHDRPRPTVRIAVHPTIQPGQLPPQPGG